VHFQKKNYRIKSQLSVGTETVNWSPGWTGCSGGGWVG